MKLKRLIFTFIVFAIVLSCEKKTVENETNEGRNKVKDIEVLPPEIFSEGGVKLSIKVNSVPSAETNAFSLVVSEDSLFTKIVHIKNFPFPISIKSYSYLFASGFSLGQKYYYSYMISYGKINLNEVKSFTFGNEKPITIDSISPRLGNIGDTLNIYGNFKDYHFTKIMIGDSSFVNYFKASDELIKLSLNNKTPTGSNAVTLFTKNQHSISRDEFSLLKPIIHTVPKDVEIGQEVIITGENFSPKPNGNRLYLDNVQVNVISYSKNTLRFIIPTNINLSGLAVALEANNYRVTAADQINLSQPQLLESPSEIRLNKGYSIKFKKLPNVKISVKLGGHDVNINHISDQGGFQTIFFSARGDVNYTSKSTSLIVYYLDKHVVVNDNISIVDKWELITSTIPFEVTSFVGSAEINNVTYIGANKQGVYDGNYFRLWKFVPANDSFTEISVPFSVNSPLITSDKNLIYFYSGIQDDNFYAYNPLNKEWKKLQDYPATSRQGAVMNIVNGKIYITGGTNNFQHLYDQPDNSLYCYDVLTNKWNLLEEYPSNNNIDYYANRVHATSLSLNNNFIVVGGAKTTGNVEVMAYNTISKNWERKADYPPLMYLSSFVHNNLGFVLKDNIHKYDLNLDKWSIVDENVLPYAYFTHTRATFFKHGNYAYCLYNNSPTGFIRIKLTDLLN